MEQKHCWVITDGRPGNENPAMGLAEAVARLAPHIIRKMRIDPGLISRGLSSIAADLVGSQLAASAGLDAPWPDLVIGCGKSSAPLVAWIRSQRLESETPVFAVQLLTPPLALPRFDLVVAPEHDNLSGPNFVSTIGSLSPVTAEKLEQAGDDFPHFKGQAGQRTLAVLIGGATRRADMSPATIGHLFDLLEDAGTDEDIRLLISLSRRSGEAIEAEVKKRLVGLPAILWDGTGENPYFACLAHADAIIVTSDSINMTSDAAATGTPVYVYEVPGLPAKFARFHQSLQDHGITRRFSGRVESWAYEPLDETRRIAEHILTQQKKCRVTRTRQV